MKSPAPHTAATPTSLAALDTLIDSLGPRLSLAPDRERATPLSTLAEQAAPTTLRPALAQALLQLGSAQVRAFPENIFWDFDALAHALVAESILDDAPADTIRCLGAQVAELQQLFGQGTSIRFRYVHDFVYGFDWSKWVRRNPDERTGTVPFGAEFLDYSVTRGHELLALIKNDDTKYPKLPDGTPRNPFGFSRDPADETRLFQALARADLIPLNAWEANPQGRTDQDFQHLRAALAKTTK